MQELPRADKEQNAAFIRDERVLVVWSEDLNTIIPLCNYFDDKLIGLVWNLRVSPTALPTAGSITPTPLSAAPSSPATPIASASDVYLHPVNARSPSLDKKEVVPDQTQTQPAPKKSSLWGWRLNKEATTPRADVENGSGANKRPMRMFAPIYGGLGAGLSICECFLSRVWSTC